eukprot:543295_1
MTTGFCLLIALIITTICNNINIVTSTDSFKDCPDKYPKSIPPLKDLPYICENVNQFKVKGTCTADNCSNCIPPTSTIMLQENKETKKWQDLYKSTTKTRRQELKQLLHSHNILPTDKDPIVLMVINRGYLYLFYNFVCSLQYNSIQHVKERILVIPTDKQTQKAIQKANIMTFYPSFLGEKMLNQIDPKMARSFSLGAHRWIVSFQIAFLNDLLNLGYNVLLQDSDIIWMRNAFLYLRQPHLRHLDIQMSVDGRMDFRGPGNSGFLYIKQNCKTKRFVNTMIRLIGLIMVGRSDQVLWNMLLDEYVFRQIHFETLDTQYFICGYQINLDRGISGGKLPHNTIIVHASWTTDQFDKIQKFYMSNTWYFNQEKCPQLYKYELLPDLKERRSVIRDKMQPQEKKFKELGMFRDSTNGVYLPD